MDMWQIHIMIQFFLELTLSNRTSFLFLYKQSEPFMTSDPRIPKKGNSTPFCLHLMPTLSCAEGIRDFVLVCEGMFGCLCLISLYLPFKQVLILFKNDTRYPLFFLFCFVLAIP